MAGRFRRFTLRVDELAAFRAAVIACARSDERELCERLMGQISSLEAGVIGAPDDGEISFRPAPGTGALSVRALEHLRAKPLRRRAPRRPVRAPSRRHAGA